MPTKIFNVEEFELLAETGYVRFKVIVDSALISRIRGLFSRQKPLPIAEMKFRVDCTSENHSTPQDNIEKILRVLPKLPILNFKIRFGPENREILRNPLQQITDWLVYGNKLRFLKIKLSGGILQGLNEMHDEINKIVEVG